MQENWKKYKLGKIAGLRKQTVRPKDFNGEKYIGLEHIGQGDFLLNGIGISSDVTSNKFKFKSGDILYGKIRPYFKKVYKPYFSGICSTDILIIKSSSEEVVTQEYLYQLIKTQTFTDKAVETSSGTKMPRAYWNSLEQVEFTFPPIKEQKSIASILSALDDKIELNLQMNKTLEEMAMALYKHWFVDFGPFQDEEFVDSELGEIPKGWKNVILGDLINLNPRLSLPKGSQASFVEMKVLPISVMSVSDVVQKEFKGGAKFQNGDTLFARITPCLENGKTAFVDFLESGEIAFGSTEFLVMRAKEGVSKYWTYCLARDTNFRKFAISTMVGTSGRQRVQNDPFLSYEIPQPPKEIFHSFSKIAEPWFIQIRLNTVENKTLTQLRDTLLPKLISGEVRVKDVEKTLSEVI